MMNQQDDYRKVNQILGKQASFGPIPAEHLVPWVMIGGLVAIIANGFFSASFELTGALMVWGCGTWWLITGRRPWRFLAYFIKPPNWTRSRVYYCSVLHVNSAHRNSRKNRKR